MISALARSGTGAQVLRQQFPKEAVMRALTLLLTAGLVAVPAEAQEWNAEQQDLIDHVTMCWDAWVDALTDETPDRFYSACPEDESAHWWWTAEGVPSSAAVVRRNRHVTREVDDDWVSLRPVYVDMFGDVGIIHHYGYWRANTSDGTVRTEHKRTEVFQRRNGVWVFIGGQGTPVAPADAVILATGGYGNVF